MVKKIIPDNVISNILNYTLIDNSFIFINLWSFIHLLSGFLLYKYITQNPYSLLILIIVYEFIEFALWGVMFKPETPIDIIWDIIMGIIGILIATKFI